MKKLTKKCLPIFALLSSLSLQNLGAEVSPSYNGEIKTRYNYTDVNDTPTQNAFQNTFSLGIKVNANGIFELVSFISTGPRYSAEYDNFYNKMTDDGYNYDPTLNVRRLYIQRAFGDNFAIQLGAIGTGEGIANLTALHNSGWIDGARVLINSDYGKMMVTMGALADASVLASRTVVNADNPNLFGRDQITQGVNYFEIRVSEEFLNKALKAEMAVEKHGNLEFVKGAVKYDLAFVAGKVIQLMAEGMVEVNTGDIIGSAGLQADLVYLLTGNFKNRVVLSAAYTYVSQDLAARATISRNTLIAPGHGVWIKVGGDISSEYRLSWGAEFRINDEGDKGFRSYVSKKF